MEAQRRPVGGSPVRWGGGGRATAGREAPDRPDGLDPTRSTRRAAAAAWPGPAPAGPCGGRAGAAANTRLGPQVRGVSGGRESPAGSHERGQRLRRPGLA